MTRYLVIGAGGQLGQDLVPKLRGEVIAPGRDRVELTDALGLRQTLDVTAPDIVVNCAAYNFVDRAENEARQAFAVNAIGVGELARWCGEHGRILVHFSTDYVFGSDSARQTPYLETDAPGPISMYGASKLAGEYLARANCPRCYIIRSCGLYGARGSGGKGGNFVETMIKLGSSGAPVRVVTDEICTPTYTVDLAEATLALLDAGPPGLYHITNSGQCSRFEFAAEIFRLAGLPATLLPITSREFAAQARRPAYAVLANAALGRLGVRPLRDWREALAAYLKARQRPA